MLLFLNSLKYTILTLEYMVNKSNEYIYVNNEIFFTVSCCNVLIPYTEELLNLCTD